MLFCGLFILFCLGLFFSVLFGLGGSIFILFWGIRKNRKLNGVEQESGGNLGERIMISICSMEKGLNKNNREKSNFGEENEHSKRS